MQRRRRLLLMTFIESFATICVERSGYFYARKELGFTDAENLYLALALGAAYVVGALSSHAVAMRVREKRLLVAAIVGQILVHLALWQWVSAPLMFASAAAIGLLNGLKWPVIESYVSAGQNALTAAGSVGRFNVAWSLAVPLSLLTAGPMIAWSPSRLFLLAAILNATALLLTWPLKLSPDHMPHDHPERPPTDVLVRWRRLLTSARWLMLGSYCALWVLGALMPRIFEKDLQFPVAYGTGLSGLVDWARVGAFVVLGLYPRWHGRTAPLVVSAAVLPLGFGMVLSAHSPAVVLAGEVIFGAAAGMVYYAALYYALVVKNASVDAGGGHEGLIGLGFALGPAGGAVGTMLGGMWRHQALGIWAGVGPILLVCTVGALWPMVAARRRTADQA